jgi:hypothetical protein
MLESLAPILRASPPTASLVRAPGSARARPHPPHLAHTTYARTSCHPRMIPICPSAFRPALRLGRCMRRLRVEDGPRTSLHHPNRAAPPFRLSVPRHASPRASARNLEHDASAFGLRMATEQVYMRATTAHIRRGVTTATTVTPAARLRPEPFLAGVHPFDRARTQTHRFFSRRAYEKALQHRAAPRRPGPPYEYSGA